MCYVYGLIRLLKIIIFYFIWYSLEKSISPISSIQETGEGEFIIIIVSQNCKIAEGKKCSWKK